MSETMDEIVSFRTTKSIKAHLENVAKRAGCHSLSEYARRRTLENEADSIRNMLLLIQDLTLSSVAFNNFEIEMRGLDATKVKEAMDEYKISIIQSWHKKNGTEPC